MNAIQKTKILCLIILLIVFFGACSTKKKLTSSSTAVAVDTATHQTAFQSLKPKPTYYLQFNSQLNNIPTPKPKTITTKDLYEFAFEDLKAMLEGKDSVDFEKAIYITENVYYRNKVKYDDYLRVLDHHTKRINALIAANDKSASMDFKVYANFRERGLSYTSLRYTESEKRELYRKALTNWAIFTYLTDTLTFGQKQQLPFAYQIDDPFGMDNWSNSQVLHLLGSMEKKGNCFALVALFKIFSNRLNSEAYICTAPQHIYLQHRDEKGDFYNLELATKTYPSDGTLMTLTFTHKEAIMSGISLRRLKTDKQNIVLCLVNLGKSYEHKFGTREDDFMLKCAELALQHDSLNLNAMLLKQQVLEERVMKFVKADSLNSIAALQSNETFKQLEKHTLHLYDKGYHQMPLYMQEIILSKLQQDNKPLVIKDRTPNPFTSIKVPAKNRRYSTLSGGLYEEVHAPKQLEEYGYITIDLKAKKIVKIENRPNNNLLIDPVAFAWQIDPLTSKYPSWSPYMAFANNPILLIDPDGQEPIKPQAGTIGGFVSFFNNTSTKMGLTTGESAKIAMLRLGMMGMDWKHARPMPLTTAPFNSAKDRYIYTEKGGWIDMAHFTFYAGLAYKYKLDQQQAVQQMNSPSFAYLPPEEQMRIIKTAGISPQGEAVQAGYIQEASDKLAAPYSAYSYEDLPSDKFGADFGANYFDPNSKLTFGEQLQNYFNNVLKSTTPQNAPNYECLPLTEPTKKPTATNTTTTPQTPICIE